MTLILQSGLITIFRRVCLAMMTCMLLVSCDLRNTLTKVAENNKEDVVIRRYDLLETRFFSTGDYSALQTMRTQYPQETQTLIENVLHLGGVDAPHINKQLYEYYQDSVLVRLVEDVNEKYADVSDLTDGFKATFDNMKEMLPQVEIPTVYTQIGALSESVVVSGNNIGISLDKYMGSNYPLYSKYYNPEQQKQMERVNILPDAISFYLLSKFPLKNFDTATQQQRDEHISRIMWVTNKVIGKDHFNHNGVKRVEEYMKQNEDVSMEQLLLLEV